MEIDKSTGLEGIRGKYYRTIIEPTVSDPDINPIYNRVMLYFLPVTFVIILLIGFFRVDKLTKEYVLGLIFIAAGLAVVLVYGLHFIIIGFRYLYMRFSKSEKRKQEFRFICPHCLKTILMRDLHFNCPFCEAEFHGDIKALFEQCPESKDVIQYIDCYHCGEPINLFAPYNEKELEKKRYE